MPLPRYTNLRDTEVSPPPKMPQHDVPITQTHLLPPQSPTRLAPVTSITPRTLKHQQQIHPQYAQEEPYTHPRAPSFHERVTQIRQQQGQQQRPQAEQQEPKRVAATYRQPPERVAERVPATYQHPEKLDVAATYRQPLIANRYKVLHKLGEGGMGLVYEAWDSNLERKVCIKVLRAEIMNPEVNAEKRFIREARKAAQVSHPNIVTVYDFWFHNSMFYLVMEKVEGINLQTCISHQEYLDFLTFYEIVTQGLQGLQAAHQQGIIHRDMKPHNLMWDPEERRLKILDFGLAKSDGDEQLTAAHQILGSLNYLAPEQNPLLGMPTTFRSDIYSFALVCYNLLTHTHPFKSPGERFQRDAPSVIHHPNVPTWMTAYIADWLKRCLKLNPDERPQSAQECLELFQHSIDQPKCDL